MYVNIYKKYYAKLKTSKLQDKNVLKGVFQEEGIDTLNLFILDSSNKKNL